MSLTGGLPELLRRLPGLLGCLAGVPLTELPGRLLPRLLRLLRGAGGLLRLLAPLLLIQRLLLHLPGGLLELLREIPRLLG